MGTQLDFDSTKRFRDVILTKTLSAPNGPQTFNSTNYRVEKLRTLPNIDSGNVDDNRSSDLLTPKTTNIFKPLEYLVKDNFETIPRRANLNLYPYFLGGQNYNLIGIMGNSNYDTESELFKFAASYIKNDQNGPVFARIQQNLYRTTIGKLRVIDALDGNTATLVNLFTGREPLIEGTSNITVANTLPGKGVDFLQTVAGVEFPWAEIPGDYLSNPANPIITRPTAQTEAGSIIQDVTGALGNLIGIQRRPKLSRKPSDLFIEYSGQRQKSILFQNLSYSKYAPDYTTTARSQNTSKLFNFVDNFSQGVKNVIGIEAPQGVSYIGDDRGDDVKYAMNDFNDRPIRSPFYLSLMFDPIQARLFEREKNIVEGGNIGGNLTWISTKSKNKIKGTSINETLSTKFQFKDGSLLGNTQDLLNTLPSDAGASRSHVANVIDQTSRVFREGDRMISRGSAVKYVDKFTKEETGVEYCRVWTKDSPYMYNSNTMKRTDLIRKYGSSILTAPWNLNIYPNSNGNGGFDGTSNIQKKEGGGFQAKKYMFSIENLAWKTSNTPGFTYNDLPYCERGPNDGRVMWFPPYDLKVTEQNSAKWESNTFLGRPEPVYTYQNTERNGTVSFKVIVDHPSILNLLVSDYFKNMSDEEADNYINAFFAGCVEVDFYSLIRNYPTLTQDDIAIVKSYLEAPKDINVSSTLTSQVNPTKPVEPIDTNTNKTVKKEIKTNLFFDDNYPLPSTSDGLYTNENYSSLYTNYINRKPAYLTELNTGLDFLFSDPWGPQRKHDFKSIFGGERSVNPTGEIVSLKSEVTSTINSAFNELTSNYNTFESSLAELKTNLEQGKVDNINLNVLSSTSAPDNVPYNLKLSYRRSHSIIKDIISKISTSNASTDLITWKNTVTDNDKELVESGMSISFADLGYNNDGTFVINYVKNVGEQLSNVSFGTHNVDCTENNNIKLNSAELRKTVPTNFFCRQSEVTLTYDTKDSTEISVAETKSESSGASQLKKVNIPKVDETVNTPRSKPPIDELKKIVMRSLSECYYFKKLEEVSPIQFTSLKEKLKYFHPAFHSMTPEGLNSRLTFLQQCIRPGDTIPIKGISDESDQNARNTTFGPPPILIMRIGDFYHSKIIIRDVNITFEEGIWDFNPEGIGVQPMIAEVTLQVNFIGGHGMEKPVERLQNALSSNFYANTEVYDPRSTATEDRTAFSKAEYEKIIAKPPYNPINPVNNDSATNKMIEGSYIGSLINNGLTLSYSELVDDVYTLTNSYFSKYTNAYDSTLIIFGSKISSMFFSPTYRIINKYDVQTGGSPEQIQLLGEYEMGSEFVVLSRNFKTNLLNEIETINLSTMFGFDTEMTEVELIYSESILKPYVKSIINDIVDGFNSYKSRVIGSIESDRNNLILSLDKLNFMVEFEQDGKIEKELTYGVSYVTPFDGPNVYSKYSKNITLIQNKYDKFTFDESFNFRTSTMTTNDVEYFLSRLLNTKVPEILNLYRESFPNYTDRIYMIVLNALAGVDGEYQTGFLRQEDGNIIKIKYPVIILNY